MVQPPPSTGEGEDGIVEIAGIGAVDGNERHVAKVVPPRRWRNLHAVRLGYRLIGKDMRDIELGKCQGAEGPRGIGGPEIVDDPCRFPDIAAAWQQFGLDEITFIRGNVAIFLKHDGVAPAALRLLKHEAATAGRHNAEQASRRGIQNPDDPAFIACTGNLAQTRQHLLARSAARGRRVCRAECGLRVAVRRFQSPVPPAGCRRDPPSERSER